MKRFHSGKGFLLEAEKRGCIMEVLVRKGGTDKYKEIDKYTKGWLSPSVRIVSLTWLKDCGEAKESWSKETSSCGIPVCQSGWYLRTPEDLNFWERKYPKLRPAHLRSATLKG